jgi:hypothetical protein
MTRVMAAWHACRSLRPMGMMLRACLALFLLAPGAGAYQYYSATKTGGNCRTCHGDFLAASYVSLGDGQTWGNLHDLHQLQVGNDCGVCHDSGPKYPNSIGLSQGGSGLPPIGCVGCHGRAQDHGPSNPDYPTLGGYGAGLRQHHTTKGIMICGGCHQDAFPASYTPVAENVLPPYYAAAGTKYPKIPTNACNPGPAFVENMAGLTRGLDNDGDGVYDMSDSDCSCTPTTCAAQGKSCGSIPDGCGSTLACGSCGSSELCVDGACVGPDAGSDAAVDAPVDAPEAAVPDAAGDAAADAELDAGTGGGAGTAGDAAAEAGMGGGAGAATDAAQDTAAEDVVSSHDAGPDAAADAADGGGSATTEDGGCGCRLAARRADPGSSLALALAAILLLARRRRS